ncbi:MAG: hypothetical protein NTW21_01545 [Verrucomicrobia bacterium]|nr:hypothetical protein [Verrucomicrobiota bacterium]
MNPIIAETVIAGDPPAVVLGELEARTVCGEELHRAASLLEEEHYLAAARPVGRTVLQAVHHQGRWVALLVWGPAALKLADRDVAIEMSPEYAAGLNLNSPERALPLRKAQLESLSGHPASGAHLGALQAGCHPLLAQNFRTMRPPQSRQCH